MKYTDYSVTQYIQYCLEIKTYSMTTKLSIVSLSWKAIIAMKSYLLVYLKCWPTVVAFLCF